MATKAKQTATATDYTFAAEQWDVDGWDKETDRISAMGFDIMGGFGVLEKYDLPRDIDTLRNFGEYTDPAKWTRYILKLYQDYIGKLGYIPKPEKNRIRDEYLKVAQETAPFISGMARAIADGCKLASDESGYVEADKDAMLEAAKPKFIRHIDTKRMSDYWQKVVEAAHTIKALKSFEVNNALPPSMNVTMCITDHVARQMICGDIDLDPRLFEKMMWPLFVKPNNR